MMTRLRAAAGAGGPVERAWCASGEAQATRARGNPTPRRWQRASEAWEALRRPYLAARARLYEAEAWLAVDDRRAAAAALEQASAACARIGAGWLAAEVEGLAARARLVLPGSEADAAPPERGEADRERFGLTRREEQVLVRLAKGMTNREIATELFMAEKTASVHVSRILMKLGVRTRTEAAATAYRHGLHEIV
jgi:DNA-binding NarL/FixJ family response regulator